MFESVVLMAQYVKYFVEEMLQLQDWPFVFYSDEETKQTGLTIQIISRYHDGDHKMSSMSINMHIHLYLLCSDSYFTYFIDSDIICSRPAGISDTREICRLSSIGHAHVVAMQGDADFTFAGKLYKDLNLLDCMFYVRYCVPNVCARYCILYCAREK